MTAKKANVVRLRKSPPLPLPPPPPGPCESRLGLRISGKGNFLSLERRRERKRLSVYGNGSCGNGVAAGGTGSSPPWLNGWQRSRRHAARHTPRKGPWLAIATAAYSEHVGRNRHPPGLSVCKAGESQRR